MHDDKAEKDAALQRVVTRKRREFAKLRAAGLTQADAYEGAFNVRGGSRNAHQVNGSRIAKLPEVQELIRQYEEEILPLGDLRAEQESILSHLKALAFTAVDEKTRVSASIHLYQLLEIHRQTEERIRIKRQATSAIPVDAVVSELLQLAQSQPEIELETIETIDSDVRDNGEEESGESR
jgi:hypothetical protein